MVKPGLVLAGRRQSVSVRSRPCRTTPEPGQPSEGRCDRIDYVEDDGRPANWPEPTVAPGRARALVRRRCLRAVMCALTNKALPNPARPRQLIHHHGTAEQRTTLPYGEVWLRWPITV